MPNQVVLHELPPPKPRTWKDLVPANYRVTGEKNNQLVDKMLADNPEMDLNGNWHPVFERGYSVPTMTRLIDELDSDSRQKLDRLVADFRGANLARDLIPTTITERSDTILTLWLKYGLDFELICFACGQALKEAYDRNPHDHTVSLTQFGFHVRNDTLSRLSRSIKLTWPHDDYKSMADYVINRVEEAYGISSLKIKRPRVYIRGTKIEFVHLNSIIDTCLRENTLWNFNSHRTMSVDSRVKREVLHSIEEDPRTWLHQEKKKKDKPEPSGVNARNRQIVFQFCPECLVDKPNSFSTSDAIWSEFKHWAGSNKQRIVPRPRFFIHLVEWGQGRFKSMQRSSGYGYRGIHIRSAS